MSAPSLSALPRFGRGSFWLVVITAAASAFVADQPIARTILLGPDFAAGLALWQPLSAILLFPDGEMGGLLATILLQWLVGSPVEARLGSARYLGLVLGAGVLGYLALGLLSLAHPPALALPQGGTGPLDAAALAAFGVLFAHQPVSMFGLLPLTSRSFAAAAIGLLLLGQGVREGWPALVPVLVAVLCALLLARRWQSGPSSGKVGPRHPAKARPRHLRIVDGREHYLN